MSVVNNKTGNVTSEQTLITAIPTTHPGGGWVGNDSFTGGSTRSITYWTTARTITTDDSSSATFTINDADSTAVTLTCVKGGKYRVKMTSVGYWQTDTASHEIQLIVKHNTTETPVSELFQEPSGTSDSSMTLMWDYMATFTASDTLLFRLNNDESDSLRTNSFYIYINRII